MYKLWYPVHQNVYIVFFGFHCGCTNLPVAPNRFVSLYWALQWLPLNYVDHFVEGCVFVCVSVKPACSMCAVEGPETRRVCSRAHAAVLHMGVNDLVLIVWTCACDKCVVGEACVMSTNSNNNNSYAGCRWASAML